MVPKIQLIPVPEGYKVLVQHTFDAATLSLLARTKRTAPKYCTYACVIEKVTGDICCEALSICSHRDTPSRKLGRAIAHNRVMKVFNEQRG